MKKPEPFFRVVLRAEPGAKWKSWTVYRDLDDAILAGKRAWRWYLSRLFSVPAGAGAELSGLHRSQRTPR